MLPFQLPSVIGHRGAAAHAPENTLAGVRCAANLHIPWVEVDATLVACGEVVIFHDTELERCSNGQGAVALHTYEELRRLDAGSWFAPKFKGEVIPNLSLLLTELNRLGLGVNLEIKPTAGQEAQTARHIADVLQTHASLPDILVSSFSQQALKIMQQRMPELSRGLLTMAIPEDWREVLSDLSCTSLHCDWRFLTQDKTQALRQAGYKVVVYTVNDPHVAHRLFSWGVDSIISDRPDALLTIAPPKHAFIYSESIE